MIDDIIPMPHSADVKILAEVLMIERVNSFGSVPTDVGNREKFDDSDVTDMSAVGEIA